MKKTLFMLLLAMAGTAVYAAEGALPGKFTVNVEGKQVQFAKGNLQYNPHEAYWNFAGNQYDYIGADNSNIKQGTGYEGMIDLFGWGTSGYNNKYPYMNSTTTSDYGNPDNDRKSDIAGTKYDWGAMLGDDIPGKWRTLTYEEWDYLFNTRTNAALLRGQATVNGKHGYILLPDDWTTPDTQSFTATPNNWTSNNYSTIGWAMMEAAGAVFLPCAGLRINGNTISLLDSEGYYWSASADGSNKAYKVEFTETNAVVSSTLRQHGFAVRLVSDVPKYYKVTVKVQKWNSEVEDGGTVSVVETGIDLNAVEEGTTLHFTATPDEKFLFHSWKNYDPETGLTVTSDTIVTAVFISTWKITLPEVEGGHVSVKYKDTDHELTADELAAVPDSTILTFTAIPDEGYRFAGWTPASAYASTTYIVNQTITYDFTVTPVFRKNGTFAVTIQPQYGGEVVCTTDGVNLNEIAPGTTLTFKAIPVSGYAVNRWGGSPDLVVDYDNARDVAQLTVTQDETVTCYFDAIPTYQVTFSAQMIERMAPPRHGERRMPADFACGTVRCYNMDRRAYINSGDYVIAGTRLFFDAWPECLGFMFDHWSDDEQTTEDGLELVVNSDIDVVGLFKEVEQHSLTLRDDGNGVITIYNGEPGEQYYIAEPLPVYEGTRLYLVAHPNIGYEFDHWDNYVDPVWDEEGEDWILQRMPGSALTVTVHFRPKAAVTTAEGALPGLFTIGEDSVGNPIRVQFSKGNLQYIAGDGKTHKTADGTAQGTWQFAQEQIEYAAGKNINAAADYEKPIDIFLYGTSGCDSHYPWLAAQTPITEDIAGTNYDWGVYNAISNGGNEPGQWRTLTVDEWSYMLYERGSGTTFVYYGRQLHGVGTADGEPGFFLMPDGWVMPGELAKENVLFMPFEVEDYVTNKYRADAWSILEQSGVVFLPVAGARVDMGAGAQIMLVGQYGAYHTSTLATGGIDPDAYFVGLGATIMDIEGGATIQGVPVKDGGCSVRLVRNVSASEISTGIEDIAEQGSKEDGRAQKLLLPNGEIRILLPDGTIYNVLGVKSR